MSTTRTRPVVVGFDGTEGSLGALRFAVVQAAERGGPLRVVHALPGRAAAFMDVPVLEADLELARRTVRDRALAEIGELAADLSVEMVVRDGSPAGVVLDEASDAAAVIVGKETKHLVERLVSGRTTDVIAGRSPVRVFVVPSGWSAERRTTGRLVVGLEDADHSGDLLRAAFEDAVASSSELQVVHAWQLSGRYADRVEVRTHADVWTEEGHRMVEGELMTWRRAYPQVAVSVQVVHGDPTAVLLEASAQADRLVLLRPRRTRLGPHLGHVAHAVLGAAHCPVEIVPATNTFVAPLDLDVEREGRVLR